MNPFDMMKNFQHLQTQMQEMQERLGKIVVVGASGGGLVKVALSGKFEVLDLSIEERCIVPSERKMLEDLIRAAFNDAYTKVTEKLKEETSVFAGGLPFLPGMGSQ